MATGVVNRKTMNETITELLFHTKYTTMNYIYSKVSFIQMLGISSICLLFLIIQAGCQGCYGLGITDLDGIVVDENGRSIEGAKVILRGKPLEIGGIDYVRYTDKDGKFEIQFGHQPGQIIHDVKITVCKDGYETYIETMEILNLHPRIVLKKKSD